MVRIGELAASANPGDVLVALGLGSCVGVALVDRGRRVAGLAHVMLPESPKSGPQLRCADAAVPALVERVLELGARRSQLEVALVGGAQMFAGQDTVTVGARNGVATRAALDAARLRIHAEAIGGGKGRTMRVTVGGDVEYREAGGELQHLLPATGAGAARHTVEATA
jgi:chemotaxis protein CheD